jgi:acetyl esterase/lipase
MASRITASPDRATVEQVPGLPPAPAVDQADVLRDEGDAHAATLRTAGVPTTTARHDGTVHDVVQPDPLRDAPPTATTPSRS